MYIIYINSKILFFLNYFRFGLQDSSWTHFIDESIYNVKLQLTTIKKVKDE